MTRDEFQRRLNQAHWPNFSAPIPWAKGTRVYAVGADEIWTVDFFEADGSIEAEVYRLADPSAEPLTDASALEDLFGRLARAWREAARDLGIRFESPYTFTTPSGLTRRCAGHLPDFGGPQGMLIVSREDPDDVHDLAEELGIRSSGLSPRHYERYDRERFVLTLSDWGWYGAGVRPSWMLERR